MAPREHDQRGAAIYGRDPDPELVARLVAAAPPPPSEAGEGAVPVRRSGGRRRAPTAVLIGGAAVLAVGAAVGVGSLGRGAAPGFVAPPTATAISQELTRTRTIPVAIDGAPAGCRIAVELTLRDPSRSGVAQLGRMEAFVRHHRWAVTPSDARSPAVDGSSPGPDTARSVLIFGALREGMTRFESQPVNAHWDDRVLMQTRAQC